jgi:hypothetical protein
MHLCWDEIQFFLMGFPILWFSLSWTRAKISSFLLRKGGCSWSCPCDPKAETAARIKLAAKSGEPFALRLDEYTFSETSDLPRASIRTTRETPRA